MRLILRFLFLFGTAMIGAAAFRASPHHTRRTWIITAVPPLARSREPTKCVSGNSSNMGRPTRTTTTTQLGGFLPPSGGGNGRSGDGLGAVATGVLTFAGITLFFLSPLGGLFFAVFNSLLALSILVPVGGFVAFQVWTYLNTVKGNCANCGAPVQAMKDGTPSICFSCGSIVQARDGEIYLANPNPRDIFVDGDGDVVPMGGWINGQGGPSGRTEIRRTTSTTIIDVDAKRDDD